MIKEEPHGQKPRRRPETGSQQEDGRVSGPSRGGGMSKAPKKAPRKTPVKPAAASAPSDSDLDEVLRLIDAARVRALAAANTALIDLYWSLGEYISRRIHAEEWGQGTVKALAGRIAKRRPNARGFSAPNLWRMRQFYETYRGQPKLSSLLRELSWTHNLLIMGKCKRDEEREFYLRLAHAQRWQTRELERQINGALFERMVLSPTKLSAPLREFHPDAAAVFKDTYLVEFVDLPSSHSEADLQCALVEQLKQFLLELGRDFCFIGSRYPVQVGGRDFEIDLLFFNRALNSLVAFELKVVEFEPEHLGKLQFYLEALDRDVKKPHERPSIGVLLCATKNNEVVEYALSRSMSPALVAEYQTRLPDKKLLQAKLHEFYALAESQAEADARIDAAAPTAAQLPARAKSRKASKKP
jgi:predicted nuclease of restriction endonuclease-like (RecB) superfamily